jgi:hypothetical protein
MVEQIMQEQSNFPTIRALCQDKRQISQPKLARPPTPYKPSTRPFINIQCSYCNAYGHKCTNCDKMAQYILLIEAHKQLDDKTKTRILENYNKTTNDRRARCIQRVKGTVRALYTEGYKEEADALWDQCHSYDGETNQDLDSTTSK